MLNTFPGLRHTVPTPAPLPPPPPPPSAEPHQDYSRLVREKAKELEKQIELFEKENAKLQSLCNERNSAIKKLKQDRDDFEKLKQKEIEEFNQIKDEEMKKIKHEKRLFEQHRQQLRDHPDKREREEIETLKKQVNRKFLLTEVK
jgi:centromere protein J